MNETGVYADGFQTTFSGVAELMEFLKERGHSSAWLRKPTRNLRLLSLEKSEGQLEEQAGDGWEDILADTKANTRLVLKLGGQYYPVRDCAIRTILDRAGISGPGLRKLDRNDYARVINLCLKVAKGDALIKVADGKVSAIHGGDHCDYSILEPEAVFSVTMEYLAKHFPGSRYMENSGSYDHMQVTAMWELGGNQELLDTYREALDEHGMDKDVQAPAIRLTTSDVGVSGANLYPMLLCGSSHQGISLGSPIRLEHKAGASVMHFKDNLNMLYSRYADAVTNLTGLMDIEIRNPLNCMMGVMKRVSIPKKIANEAINLYEAKHGNGACTAHDLYYAIHEAPFVAACNGAQGSRILSLEENVARALSLDWEEYDVAGNIRW